MAVPVYQHDVAGCKQGLLHHLVGRGRAVRDEEHMISSERAGCQVLGHLDIAGWFEQAVKAASGCGGFCEEKVQSIEPAHIADPVRFENRFSARDRERMECPNGTL